MQYLRSIHGCTARFLGWREERKERLVAVRANVIQRSFPPLPADLSVLLLSLPGSSLPDNWARARAHAAGNGDAVAINVSSGSEVMSLN